MNRTRPHRSFGSVAAPILTVLLGLVFIALAVTEISPSSPFIKSIVAEGADILVTVSIPSGTREVTLETGNPLAGQPWKPQATKLVEGSSSEISFRFSKPGQMLLIRAMTTPQPDMAPALSPALSYITIPSTTTAAAPASSGNRSTVQNQIIIKFRGRIDGTDKLTVTRNGILWEHLSWNWPEDAISVNGTEWIPSEKNFITTADRTALLPEGTDFSSARLKKNLGRDTVALEKSGSAAIIYVGDTPLGSDDYEFELHLPMQRAAKAVQNPGATATLTLTATIDGSDRIHITQNEARWAHSFWLFPDQVTFNNSIVWQPATNSVLQNKGLTQFLPVGVNFSSARVLKKSGRDLLAVEPQADGLLIHFADNPNGASLYEVTIGFGE